MAKPEMTSTELIAEARELDQMATPGPWVYNVTELSIDTQGENSAVVYALTDGQGYPMVSVHDNDAQFIVRSRTLIPALCDALEQAQNAQRWIPVTKKSPTGDCWVYAFHRLSKTNRVTMLYAEELDSDDYEIAYWMPYIVPQPPKGED